MPMSFDPAAPTENHIGEVGGSATKVSATFGPASSTTYTAGQVLMGTTAMAGVARIANGMGYLFGATLGLNVAKDGADRFRGVLPAPGHLHGGRDPHACLRRPPEGLEDHTPRRLDRSRRGGLVRPAAR